MRSDGTGGWGLQGRLGHSESWNEQIEHERLMYGSSTALKICRFRL